MQPTTDMTTIASDVQEVAEPMARQKVTKRQPCPCGSGKKFKSCCIDDPAYELVTEIAATPPVQPPKPGHIGKSGPLPKNFGKQPPKSFQTQRQNNAIHHRRV